MSEPGNSDESIERFIARWQQAESSERANYQMFLTELCDLIGTAHPDPAGAAVDLNAYAFERPVTRHKADGTSTTVYIDLYKRGCFVLETKQGCHRKDPAAQPGEPLLLENPAPLRRTGHGVRGTRAWDLTLERAYNQARLYIRDLPAAEGRPPFLIVCDVGYVIELYSEFTCSGGTYVRYPDPKNHRIYLEDLRDPAIRERLRAIWTQPLALDPSKHAAKVTREVAHALARLAHSLESDHHAPATIALFLQRILFTLFAEDIGLLPDQAFAKLLRTAHENPRGFAVLVTNLWKDMATGSDYSAVLCQSVAHFNGGLFENPRALELNGDQITLLIAAADKDWSEVEPAIFGTLLERALSPQERHKLGAHYTPRSYVERLVKPTIVDPLRSQWDAVKTAAAQLTAQDETPKALATIKDFHHQLCTLRVLDPACGSGNFLYVTLEHMKRLEGEVLELLETLGDTELTFEMEHYKVRPQQFHGLELNERAVAIAQLVLWIGYFQWHKKATGRADTRDRPLLPKERTIRQQDAVLAYDDKTPRKRVVAANSTKETRQKRQDAASTVAPDQGPEANVEAASSRLHPDVSVYRYFSPYAEIERSRANLPHWRQEGVTYFVTFRQADALPQHLLRHWHAEREQWLAHNPEPHTPEQRAEAYERFSTRLERWLDAGYGDCCLADSKHAQIVENALRHFDGERYHLGKFVVAANHVHVLVTPVEEHPLSAVIHGWKSFTANELNRKLGREGVFWQKESYDHIVRSPEAAHRIERYIERHREYARRDDEGHRDKRLEAASTETAASSHSSRFPVEAASSRLPHPAPPFEEFVTHWDGRTTKPHPVTGKEVPDESATLPVYDYSNPRRAEWPEADFIVGNPPFIGTSRMRHALGDGYTEALRAVWKQDVPESADFVMFWWEKAAELLRSGKIRRFGFITTNSIHQTFNRRVLEKHLNAEKNPLHLAYAIPDHPWVDSADGAAVRIAMTVADSGSGPGELDQVMAETEIEDGEHEVELKGRTGKIAENLSIGVSLTSAIGLNANVGIAIKGFELGSQGFLLSKQEAETFIVDSDCYQRVLFPYQNGRDLALGKCDRFVIDFHGFDESEATKKFPHLLNRVLSEVKPERTSNREQRTAKKWWLFRRSGQELRNATRQLDRFIATTRTARYRVFQFVSAKVRTESKIVVIAVDDSHYLGILSSTVHCRWADRTGGWLGVGNDSTYNHLDCFNRFPFPDLAEDDPLKARIRELGEQLDAHRKRQQAAHPDLTMTGMYNVLEKLNVAAASSRLSSLEKRQDAASTGSVLTAKERKIHDDGLVSLLKQIHDELDAAVLEAYGWSDLAPDHPLAEKHAGGDDMLEQELLTRLVALNHERAAEEARGHVRWLRPEYQDPHYGKDTSGESKEHGKQAELAVETPVAATTKNKLPWPKTLPEQVGALRCLLPTTGPDPAALAAHFGKRTNKRLSEIDQILTTLRSLGQL